MDTEQPAFKALADPTRRTILTMLATRSMSIAEIGAHFAMTRAGVKKHLSLLEEAGLIEVEPRGRERVNRFNPDGMAPIKNWLTFFDAFWDSKLDALKTAVEKDAT